MENNFIFRVDLTNVNIIRKRLKNVFLNLKHFTMKRLCVLFSVCLLIFGLTACNLKEKRAKEYHDALLQSVQSVIDKSLDYADGIQSYEKAKAIEAHQKYSDLVNSTLSKIENMKNFEGDTTLVVYSKELLNYYKTTLEKDHSIFLQSIKTDVFSTEETAIADSIMSDFAMTENKYWERFDWAEKKFYKDENIGKVER